MVRWQRGRGDAAHRGADDRRHDYSAIAVDAGHSGGILSDAQEADLSEIDRTLLIADLSGYTALTESHGALHASEVVLRFGRIAEASLEAGVVIVDRVGDQVLCAGADTLAVLRSALRLFEAIEREPDFLRVQAGIHRGGVVEREGRLFGAPLNLSSRIAAHARGGQILCTEPIARARCSSASLPKDTSALEGEPAASA